MRPCEQSPAIGGTESPEISEEQVEKYSDALAAVRRLLKARGVRSYSTRTISLRLSDNEGVPILHELPTLHAPELVVRGDAGVAATVTMGVRSGCYLVSLPGGRGLEALREPRQVANLILKQSGATS